LYVFWINPAVKDADYTVSKILSEAFPSEVQELYKKFSDAYAGGQTFVNLDLVSAMGPARTARRSDTATAVATP
jgi:copper oxidase (laccase) domain-containing protein